MTTWILTCPQCNTSNEVTADVVTVECGRVFCTCTCTNCAHQFKDGQPYWRWLELDEEPPTELEIAVD